jgi:hypothetical protein
VLSAPSGRVSPYTVTRSASGTVKGSLHLAPPRAAARPCPPCVALRDGEGEATTDGQQARRGLSARLARHAAACWDGSGCGSTPGNDVGVTETREVESAF